jgi:hypothetical protein
MADEYGGFWLDSLRMSRGEKVGLTVFNASNGYLRRKYRQHHDFNQHTVLFRTSRLVIEISQAYTDRISDRQWHLRDYQAFHLCQIWNLNHYFGYVNLIRQASFNHWFEGGMLFNEINDNT